MIIYQIRLPKKKDAEAFAGFMRDEYLPAVHKGATRVGQVTDLVLLQGQEATTTHEFLWHVGWSGLSSGDARIDDNDVQRKFNAFGARIKRLGVFGEVAAWQTDDEGRKRSAARPSAK
jgi:hypothetical protein